MALELVDSWDRWRKPGRVPMTPEQAVASACAADFDRNGVAECAADAAEKTAEVPSRLVQVLSDRGLMSPADVLVVVGARYEVAS